MLIADWNGWAFFLVLASADFFKDSAIFLGFLNLKTPSSKSRALLSSVTFLDQYLAIKVFVSILAKTVLQKNNPPGFLPLGCFKTQHISITTDSQYASYCNQLLLVPVRLRHHGTQEYLVQGFLHQG